MTALTPAQVHLRLLSLGAGVQSTTLLLLSAKGELPPINAAIFADTGQEPAAVYAHLDKVEREIAEPAGIPIYRVSYGNLGDDLLDPNRMAMIPAYTVTERPVTVDGRTEIQQDRGMLGRKCTQTYKLRPLLAQVRRLLGATTTEHPCRYCDAAGERVPPWRAKRGEATSAPCSVCRGTGAITRVGQPPAGAQAEQWVGFSTDEISRVSNRGDTRYSRSRYPLLELEMSREQCLAYLRHHGWDSVTKSACVFCPYRGNAEWRQLRDHAPDDWQAAVAFDEAYRVGAGMDGKRYLHISGLPLAEAPIDRVRPSERVQLSILDAVYAQRLEDGDPDGCSPYGCRSGVAA